MTLKGFAFGSLAALCLSMAACEGFLPLEEDDEDDDETGTPTNTATPTPSAAPTPVTTTDGDIVTIDWGTIALDAGESPRFDFTAPSGTISVDLMAIGGPSDQSKIFGFFSVSTPNGTVIDNSAGGPARQAFAEGAMSFSLPSDDSALTAAPAGNYRFHILAFDPVSEEFADSDPQVLVKIRTAPGATVPTGEIDVNVIVVQGVNGGITASQACTAGNPVYDGLAIANGLYDANLALTIANVTCYDLASSTAFTDINGQDELGDLFATSAGLTDARVNLFIVDSFSGQLSFAAGVAGSVPIPMGINGTRRSGVAIQYDGSAGTIGRTIAHEMGHSLGLYHTTEFNAATYGFDMISDTTECASLGASYDGTSCSDDVNVMFPQLDNSMAGFSAGQGIVIAPAVHVRRQGVSAFAPIEWVMPPPEKQVWEGAPARCMNGVVTRPW